MLSFSTIFQIAKNGALAAFILGYFGIIKKLQFYARLLVYAIDVCGCALYGVCASIVFSLLGKRGLSQWATARAFKYVCKYTLGIDVVIKNNGMIGTTGKHMNDVRPAIFLSNHQSELDICVLGSLFPKYCSVTAKKVLKYYPFLGWFMAASGSIFIDRANRTSGVRALDSAAKDMHDRQQSVFMFPEGTRSYFQKPGLLPLKKGAFHLAIQAQVPIVPAVVSNYSKIFDFKKKIFTSGTIEIEFLDVIPTEGLKETDVHQLYEKVSDIMTKGVENLGYGSKYQ